MIPKPRPMRNQGWSLLLVMLASCLGCDQMFITKDSQYSAPVSGKVLAGDQPVVNAKVLFLPLNHSNSRYRYSYATTNQQGRFTMRFESGVYGAHIGRNLVLISNCEKTETELVDGKESEEMIRPETISTKFNAESELSINVKPDGNANVIFQVSMLEDAADSAATERPPN